MATQLMKDWIVELHNPDRDQTTGQLGREDLEGNRSHCCLGVLCEVSGLTAQKREEYDHEDNLSGFYLRYDGSDSLAPYNVISDLFDLEPSVYEDNVLLVSDFDENGLQVYADRANDELGWSFHQIASVLIDEYLTPEEAFEVRKRIEDNGWV